LNGLFKSRRANVVAICYLTAVILCSALAFRPSVLNLDWVLIAIALTLPWGALTWLFVWALIHDNTHYLAMAVHIAWGTLNAFLGLGFALRRRLGRTTQPSGNDANADVLTIRISEDGVCHLLDASTPCDQLGKLCAGGCGSQN
jgi:hypothetical protein